MGWNVRVIEVVRFAAFCSERTFHKDGKDWTGPERMTEAGADVDREEHWRKHEDVRFSLDKI